MPDPFRVSSVSIRGTISRSGDRKYDAKERQWVASALGLGAVDICVKGVEDRRWKCGVQLDDGLGVFGSGGRVGHGSGVMPTLEAVGVVHGLLTDRGQHACRTCAGVSEHFGSTPAQQTVGRSESCNSRVRSRRKCGDVSVDAAFASRGFRPPGRTRARKEAAARANFHIYRHSKKQHWGSPAVLKHNS